MSKVSLFWSRVLGPTVARYGWYLVVIPLLLANLSALRAATATKVYQSSAVVTVGNTYFDIAVGLPDTSPAGTQLINRELAVALSGGTTSKVQRAPGTTLTGRVRTDTNQLVLEANALTPKAAQDAANEFAKVYIAESIEKRRANYKKAAAFFENSMLNAQEELATASPALKSFYEARVVELRARMLTSQELASQAAATTVELDTAAFFPVTPINRSPVTAALLGFIFGIGVCGAIILVLDFGQKQRVTLEDIRIARPDLRILGVSRARQLRKAALVGHGIHSVSSAAASTVVCLVYVGTRLKSSSASSAIVSSLNMAGARAVQVRTNTAGQTYDISLNTNSPSLWTLSMGQPSLAIDGRELIGKAVIDQQIDLAVVHGPQISDSSANPVGFALADHVVVVVDSTSSSIEQLLEALLILESYNRPVLGAVFIPK